MLFKHRLCCSCTTTQHLSIKLCGRRSLFFFFSCFVLKKFLLEEFFSSSSSFHFKVVLMRGCLSHIIDFTTANVSFTVSTAAVCHLPALAGRCGNPGDTVFLCRAGCCGDRRRGSVRVEVTKEVVVTRAPPGLLLNWRAAAAAAAAAF